jgi:hypothetical protein
MKKIGVVLSVLIGFSAFAQEKDLGKRIDFLKSVVEAPESFDVDLGAIPSYRKELEADLDALGPERKSALLRSWLLKAVESDNQGWASMEINFCIDLGADVDFKYTGKGFDTVKPGDRLLHVLIRNEPYKDFYRSNGLIISQLIPVSNVCLKNDAGEKPADLFECEKVGVWGSSADCDKIRKALGEREAKLGCPSH